MKVAEPLVAENNQGSLVLFRKLIRHKLLCESRHFIILQVRKHFQHSTDAGTQRIEVVRLVGKLVEVIRTRSELVHEGHNGRCHFSIRH